MTTPSAITRAPRRDATENRTALLAAAATTLNRDPLASLEAIAAEAGLSRRSVYGHFATRDDLVRQVLVVGAARIAGAMATVDEDDARVAIAVIGARLWREINHVRVMAHFAVRGPFRSEVAEGLAPIRTELRHIVERGVRAGQLRQDIEVTMLTRLIESAALSVLDESMRGEMDGAEMGDAEGRTLVMLAGLSMAGLSWQEADELVRTTEVS